MKKVYMDYAATTFVKPEVLSEMLPYFGSIYGNAHSIHSFGREAAKGLELARSRVAKAIGAQDREIFFTSGGTESDNWALRGVVSASKRGKHIITSQIEHHAILHTCKQLEKEGCEVTYLPVDKYGTVSLDALRQAIRPDTALISIMFANNEIGTVQPIAQIGKIAHENGIVFHTDAVQAVGHEPIDVNAMNIDLLSISAHKLHGPKGIGALYIRKGVRVNNLLYGGAQERGRRPGTDDTPLAAGFGKAIELACENLEEKSMALAAKRDRILNGVMSSISNVRLNGHPANRLPGNLSFGFDYIEGEALLLSLDLKGIAASSGSACTSGSLDPSHVLLAIGLPHETAHGSLRITIGDETTDEEIDYFLAELPPIIKRLRDMSPLTK